MAEDKGPKLQELFEKEKKRFGTAVNAAIAVSKAAAGRAPKRNVVMGSYVFTRMCVCAETLNYLLQRTISGELILDHYSMGVMARNIIEAGLMFHYLMEDGVSEDEWALRSDALDLHDVLIKLQLFKSLGDEKEHKAYRELMEEKRAKIRENGVFKCFDAQQREKLLGGGEAYLKGMRSTLKLVSLETKYFNGMYPYLSSQVHVLPSSFYFTHERLSFGKPGSYQYYFAAYSLAHARMVLTRSTKRLADSDEAVRKKVDDDVYKSVSELAEIPFGE